MSKQGNPKLFNGAQWRQKKTAARTVEALRQRDREYSQAHLYDTIEQHLEYIRQCAKEIGHTPQVNEVLGGQMIAQRCGGWNIAIESAGLPAPTRKVPDNQTRLYRMEYAYQDKNFKEISKQEQQRKNAAGDAKAAEEKAKEKAERLARHERDMRWGEEHQDLDYDGLASYLYKCATEMGRSPYSNEVVGGGYICMLFGTWALALNYANLPMPSGTKAPTPAERKKLQAKINSCQPGITPETYTTE